MQAAVTRFCTHPTTVSTLLRVGQVLVAGTVGAGANIALTLIGTNNRSFSLKRDTGETKTKVLAKNEKIYKLIDYKDLAKIGFVIGASIQAIAIASLAIPIIAEVGNLIVFNPPLCALYKFLHVVPYTGK